MKKIIFSLALVGLWCIPAMPVMAQSPPCIPDLYGKMTCPPPNGGMMVDMQGNTVCGPGSCARNSRGQVRCAALPGGQVVIDSSGNVLCIGGCVDGDKKSCMTPTP